MNFRELIITRVKTLLESLVVEESQVVSGTQGRLLITPNDNYTGCLRAVKLDPLDELPFGEVGTVDTSADAPIAYVSFDGGRNDLGTDTFLSHIVETLGIRIEILLNKKIGVNVNGSPRQITYQASDLLADITKLVNLTSLQSAVHFTEDDVTVQDVILEEWEFDDRFRGSDKEVLILVFQAEIANPRTP